MMHLSFIAVLEFFVFVLLNVYEICLNSEKTSWDLTQ